MLWSIYSILMYIILYSLSFNYFYIFGSNFYEIAARNPQQQCRLELSWDPLRPHASQLQCRRKRPAGVFHRSRASNKKLSFGTKYRDSWVIQIFRKMLLNLGEYILKYTDFRGWSAGLLIFLLSWGWTSRELTSSPTTSNEVWFSCSKHNFVEALCPLLIIFDLKVDLKNVNIIETWKQRHFISSVRIANSPTSRGLQKLLAIRKRKANILAHRIRLLVLCHIRIVNLVNQDHADHSHPHHSLKMMLISSNPGSNQSNQSPWTSKAVTTFTRFILIQSFLAFQDPIPPHSQPPFFVGTSNPKEIPWKEAVRSRLGAANAENGNLGWKKRNLFPWLRSIRCHSWHSGRSLVLNP